LGVLTIAEEIAREAGEQEPYRARTFPVSAQTRTPYVNVPDTISPAAQAFLSTIPDPHLIPPFPDPSDIAGWRKLQAWAEADGKAKSEPLLKRYPHFVTPGTLGNVPVLDVRPENWQDNGRAIVYTHGGAHVMYSAESTLGRAVIAAHVTGLRVLSVDYTLAPHAKFDRMSDEVVAAIEALMNQGQRLEDTAIYGDSSGGGLAAATVLKMRDRGLGMPRVAILVSPWLDVTPSGDTETTLHDADPNALYERQGKAAAGAFADPKDQKHPYASPVYGDFSKGFPPTLIQGGLKETLLSGFVRFYQAIDAAGVTVKLDLYEGMIHNFQDRMPDAPEAVLARTKMRNFLSAHFLGCSSN
jgi:epsilon-lactone hydrolase